MLSVTALVATSGLAERGCADPVFRRAWSRSRELWREGENRFEFGDGLYGWTVVAIATAAIEVVVRPSKIAGGRRFTRRRVMDCSHSF